MSLRAAKIVSDLKVYQAKNTSKEKGRKVLADLKERGVIAPDKTRTGRNWLTFDDAERLANAL